MKIMGLKILVRTDCFSLSEQTLILLNFHSRDLNIVLLIWKLEISEFKITHLFRLKKKATHLVQIIQKFQITVFKITRFICTCICKLVSLTIIYTSLRDISDSSSLHNISYYKLLDGLILRDTPSTVCATDILGMTTPFLASSVITPFRSLQIKIQ